MRPRSQKQPQVKGTLPSARYFTILRFIDHIGRKQKLGSILGLIRSIIFSVKSQKWLSSRKWGDLKNVVIF